MLAADVRANREFAVDVLGYRLYERIELDDGTEAGAWMSATIAAHELIYTKDAYGAHGRLHHLAFWVDTREECLRAADIFLDDGIQIEAAPSKHAIAQGFFLYGIEPGGNRIEVTTGGYFVYDPDQPADGVDRGRAREGPGVGRQDGRELPHVRHAAGRGARGGPALSGRVALVVARVAGRQRALELADPLAERLARVGQALGAEDDEGDRQDDDQFHGADAGHGASS